MNVSSLFAQPLWLLVGLLVCLSLWILFQSLEKSRQRALEKFACHQLVGQLSRNISRGKRLYKNILILAAILACFAALARPQYGYKWVDVKRKGIDLLFALDTSKSMLAEDIRPNRLARAKLAILDFVQQLDGDRVGLLPFAGSAYLMCPLTLDYMAFEQSLSAVDSGLIPRGGTNIGEVISSAAEILSGAANHKILIILTDGENLEGDVIGAARQAASEGVTIFTVGVGTSEGELIPLATGKNGFVKDDQGNFVTSRLNQQALSEIAAVSGGLYAPLGNNGEGLEKIYQEKLALIPKDELAERRHKVPIERFEWAIALALLLLLADFLTGERKNNGLPPLFAGLKSRLRRPLKKSTTAILLSGLLLSGLLIYSSRASASQGEEAYLRGDFLKSSEYYNKMLENNPDDPRLLYNSGTASYKNGLYDNAIDAFTKSLTSDDLQLQQKAYFNRGNSYYQKGVEMQQGNPEGTIEQWQQALDSLDSALTLAPEDQNARNNQQLIKKQLEELQQQLKEQQQQQQGNSDKEDQQQKSQQDQNGSEQQQGEQPGEQQKDEQSGDSAQEQQSGASQQGENGPQQQDEQQQPADSGDEKSGAPDGKEDAAQSANGEAQPQSAEKDKQAREDMVRRKQGKMTREEAESLLNALKNQEGELNFVPAKSGGTNDVSRDW
jgi:Ca-activated chloride channel family protein